MFIEYTGKFKTLFDLHQTFKTIKSKSIHQLAVSNFENIGHDLLSTRNRTMSQIEWRLSMHRSFIETTKEFGA
jgi:hypothetical protein